METLQLPVILDRLSPEARSWVIAKSASSGVPVETLARQLIEDAAARDGFIPPHQPDQKKEAA